MKGLAVFPCFCAAAGRSGVLEGVQSLPLRKGFAGFARGVSLAVSVESPTSDRAKKDPSASNSLLKGFFGLIGVSHRCHQCDDCIPGPETETLAQIRQIHRFTSSGHVVYYRTTTTSPRGSGNESNKTIPMGVR